MWKTQMPMIGHIRLGLLCVAWVAALIQVTTGTDLIDVVNLGVIAFIGFVLLTLSRLRHDSVLILLLLVVVGWALLDHFPDGDEWATGGRYVLIFTALLPTMALGARDRLNDAVGSPNAGRAGAITSFGLVGWDCIWRPIFLAASSILARWRFCRQPFPKMLMTNAASLLPRPRFAGMVTAAAWSPFFRGFCDWSGLCWQGQFMDRDWHWRGDGHFICSDFNTAIEPVIFRRAITACAHLP
jgi:hypothetical protein